MQNLRAAAIAALFAVVSCRNEAPGELTVSVASSLQNAMRDIQAIYAPRHPAVRLTFNFGSSGALAQQIEQGAPVSVFLSAAPQPVDRLQSRGLIDSRDRRALLRNEIALIAPAGTTVPASFAALVEPAVTTIALGDPASVPAGQYGREVLKALGVWDRVKSKLVLAKDVRQVLTYVETGNAPAGIVYRTDARESNRVRVVALAPENTHAPVLYPVAVLKGAPNPAAAREFVQFLAGAEAAAVFARHGFTTVAP